jgi:sensory rhodopsin
MPPLSAHGADNAVTSLTTSQAFVHYALFVAMMALGAGFVFFLSSKEKILPQYRGTLTTSAMICGVAAVAYYFLTSEYGPGKPFPIDIRYVDWTVTTPLLLIKYPEMLRVRGSAFAWKLIVADLFMIVTGFIGELYGHETGGHWVPDTDGGVSAHFVWGAISTVGYLVIVWLLLTEGARLAKTQPMPIQHGIKTMNLYLLTLWGVYPITYIAEGLSATHPALNLDWFNVASSVADVINKVGFGLTAYFAVRALSGDDQQGADRLPESAAA